MTLLHLCIHCQYGHHEEHNPVPQPGTPGLIGSRTECPCEGECQSSEAQIQRQRAYSQRYMHSVRKALHGG